LSSVVSAALLFSNFLDSISNDIATGKFIMLIAIFQTANQQRPHLMPIGFCINCHKHVFFAVARLFEIDFRVINVYKYE